MASNIKSGKEKATTRDDKAKVSGELQPKDLDKVTGGLGRVKKSGDPEDGGN